MTGVFDEALRSDHRSDGLSALEAYRRLAAVTSQGEVEDIRAEWVDRYGPVPAEAAALLGVARLRAECHRTGVREVVVTKAPAFGGGRLVARFTPMPLKMSQTIRLGRLYKGAVYKEEAAQVQVPLRGAASAADEAVEVLTSILPPTVDRVADEAPVVPQGAACDAAHDAS